MKRLTIVGRGTVGSIAAAHFLKWTDWEINWVFDPDIKPTAVGEGTTLIPPRTLFTSALSFNAVDMQNVNATCKVGILKRNWGTGKEFLHPFPAGQVGLHFNAVKLQDYIFNKLSNHPRLRVQESKVEDFENLDSDFVMACTGTPNFDDNYTVRDKIPYNACKVFQCPWDSARFDYTLTFAMKHGWIFGIPLKNRCAIGYVHNDKFCTPEDIDAELVDIFTEFGLTPVESRVIKFKNYSKKVNYTKKVAYNGNASFFLEPLEATSTSVADYIIRDAFDMWNGNLTIEEAEQKYHTYLDDIELMLSLHYFAGSSFDTPFWAYAKNIGKESLVNSFNKKGLFYNMIKDSILYNSKENNLYDLYKNVGVGTWPFSSYVTNINGFGIKDKLAELLSLNSYNEYRKIS